MSETRKLAAILVVDIVGFSRLTRTDEERTLARLRALRGDLVAPAVAAHHGRIVKGTGDGSISEFRSVVDAARCAIEMQNGLVERNAGVPPERRIEFRIGIHVGEVVEESDGDLMGDAVNVAARLEGIAKPGAICLSEDAYRQVKGRVEMEVRDLGPTKLKNIAEPVRAYLIEVGAPAEPLNQLPVPRRRLVVGFATLVILVIAGGVGWRFIANAPATTVISTATPAASSPEPPVDVMPPSGNPATTTPQTQTHRQAKPVLMSEPVPQPIARRTARPLVRGQPSSLEPAQSASVESGSNTSEPCFNSAAQTSGNHPSCAYLHGQASNAEPEPSSPVESGSNTSGPCFNSAAQTNGNHPSCAYLRGH